MPRQFHSIAQNTHAIGFAEKCIVAAILLVLMMQTYLVFVQEVNWDEFFYLSKIYAYQAGTLDKALQSFMVHFFGWLPSVNADEVEEVERARVVMLSLQSLTALFIFFISRNFCSRPAALLAVLAFVSAGFTVTHGASFRADPIATFLIVASIALLSRSRLQVLHCAISALLIGIAVMITVKTIFLTPALITIGLWQVFRSENRLNCIMLLSLTAIGSVGVFGLLYLWHQSGLPEADIGGSQSMMASAATATLLEVDFLPRWRDLLQGFSQALIPAIFLILGLFRAVSEITKGGESRAEALVVLGLAGPLLTFFFYRNAFPYFFPFIFAPAMVLVGYGIDKFRFNKLAVIAAAAVMVIAAGLTALANAERDQEAQSEIIETVHKIFPEPVPAIDRNSMIASFPKRGIFMSSWGLQAYRENGTPVFKDILDEEPVPLLILNSPTLERAMGEPISGPLRGQLFPADQKVLQSNYVEHWGKIWVAGKEFSTGPASEEFSVRIPGRYILESKMPVNVNDVVLQPGEVILLSREAQTISSENQQRVVLRWAAARYRPQHKPSEKPVYRGF